MNKLQSPSKTMPISSFFYAHTRRKLEYTASRDFCRGYLLRSISFSTLFPATLLMVGCINNVYSQSEKIIYTHIKHCVEQVDNDDAAFSNLRCKEVDGYNVHIRSQSPQYYIIQIVGNGIDASSALDTYTHEKPMAPGNAIEWHFVGSIPKFMVFRMRTESSEGETKELLTLNLVQADRICPVASIDARRVKNANARAHELIASTFSEIQTCPEKIMELDD
jgi:hypothetical protein